MRSHGCIAPTIATVVPIAFENRSSFQGHHTLESQQTPPRSIWACRKQHKRFSWVLARRTRTTNTKPWRGLPGRGSSLRPAREHRSPATALAASAAAAWSLVPPCPPPSPCSWHPNFDCRYRRHLRYGVSVLESCINSCFSFPRRQK